MSVPGWWVCKHASSCHPENTRRKEELVKLNIVVNSGSGWKNHARTHKCNPHCFGSDESNEGKKKARRKLNHEEFVKYAGLLHRATDGVELQNDIKIQYETSWKKVYPDYPIRLSGGIPEDLSNLDGDSLYAASTHGKAAAVSPGSTIQNPVPSTSHPSVTPTSTVSYPMNIPHPLSLNPTSCASTIPIPPTLPSCKGVPASSHDADPAASINPTSSVLHQSLKPAPTMSYSFNDGNSLVSYLREHTFHIKTTYMFSQIVGGLVPGFHARAQPTGLLRVVFVETPAQRHGGNLKADPAFLTHTEVDIKTYTKLQEAVPLSVAALNKTHREGGIPIAISSSLLLAVEMFEQDTFFDVDIVNWEDYSKTLITMGEGNPSCQCLWDKLCRHTDLIIGGLNFANDIFDMKMSGAIPPNDVKNYYISSRILSRTTTVWASPDDLLVDGHKQEMQFLLMVCAASLGMEHPIIIHIEDQDLENTVKELVNGTRQGVLKRSLSGTSEHVITQHTKNPLEVLKRAVEDQKNQWSDHRNTEGFSPPRWFFQPYMPLLLYLGELRTFIVNGAIYHTAYTTPTELGNPASYSVTSGHTVRPLQSFGFNSSRPTDSSATGLLHIDGASSVDPADFVNDTFHEFVLNMLGKLVLAEEKLYKRFSGLRIFVRMDVSIYRNKVKGEYKYVVNEVTRGHHASLFHGVSGDSGAYDHFLDSLTKLLHYFAINKLGHSPQSSHSLE